MLVETGIAKLDEILGGGVRKGSSTLLLSMPGVDPTVFLLQIAHDSLGKKKKCLFYIDSKFPAALKDKVKEISLWERKRFEEVIFVDGFSAKVGLPSSEKYFVKDTTKADEVKSVINKVIKENKDGAVFLLEDFEKLTRYGEGGALSILEGTLSSTMAAQTTSIISAVNWNLSEDFLKSMKDKFDYIVRLDSVEEKFLTRNYFYIEKAPQKFTPVVISYRVGMDGIGVYVPKILITGPYHSGKSSFIHKVSTRAVSVDRIGTTVALDHGYIDYGGIGADLFGTPGQERFEFMLDILKKEMFGLILVVDSTDPKTFGRAIEMLNYVRKEAIPYVIAANKQDLKEALSTDEIRKQMAIPAEIPVLKTSALTGEGCLDSVKTLIDLVIKKGVKKEEKEETKKT